MDRVIELEFKRNNVTPAEFLSYVRRKVKEKEINLYIMSVREFATLRDDCCGNPRSHGNYKTDFWETSPYHSHGCTIMNNGCGFNEIYDFDFDDEKKGHGYFYYWEKLK